MSFWIKPLSTLQYFTMQWDFGIASTVNANRQAKSTPYLTNGVWQYLEFVFTCPFDNCNRLSPLFYTGPGSDFTMLMSEPMIEQITDEDSKREYAPPTLRPFDFNNTDTYWTLDLPTNTSVAWWGDSLTNGSSGGEPRTALSRLLGNAYVYDGGVGGETSTQIKTRMVADDYYKYAGVVVIWAGNNNSSAFQTVIDDIDAMVGHLDHSRFLILGLINNVSCSLDGSGYLGYRQVAKVNAHLAHKYGTKYIDPRRLVTTQSPTATTNDIYLYDTIHLTPVGHALIGEAVYQAIRRNGYIADKRIVGTTALTEKNGVAWDRVWRPSNTTAYDIGDLIADTTTAGDVLPMVLCVPFDHQIRRIRLAKSGTSLTNASFRVHLYGDAPTVTNGDNGAFQTDKASYYIGYADITMVQAFSDGACGWVAFSPAMGQTACTGGLFALIEARAAYTPASEEKFTLAVEHGT
jgi:lysophospholipase L1-like esterase